MNTEMECYYDNNPVCFEQTRLILDLLKKLDNEKTTSGIYQKAFNEYENYIKNEGWVFLGSGNYKVIKFDDEEYKKVKNENIKELINLGIGVKNG